MTVALEGKELTRETFLKLGSQDRRQLMDGLGQELEGQTRKRLNQPRGREVGPNGAAWPRWSDEYAETRHPNHRMLQNEGRLLDSITHRSTEDSAAVGTNVVYAAIHQFGGVTKRAARKTTIRLRTTQKGELLRQGKEGPLANLAVFARSKGARAHKRIREMVVDVPEHEIDVPARPFLGVSTSNARDLERLASDYFRSMLP